MSILPVYSFIWYASLSFVFNGLLLNFIGTRSQIFIIFSLRKSLDSWAKELKNSRFFFGTSRFYMIGSWSRSFILVVDHLPQFSFERVISVVNLSLQVWFYWLWGKHSRRVYFLLPVGCDFRKSSLFFLTGVLLFGINCKPLLFV